MVTTRFCEICGTALSTRANPCPSCGCVQPLQTRTAVAQQVVGNDDLQPGSLLRQRYRIQKKIGEGGFGLVYKAWDEQRRRPVAIKQITLASLSAREMIEATDSYNRETTFLPKLRHKNVPALYHQFTDPGHWYIAMQYIEGLTLEELLAEAPQKRLPVGEVLAIAMKLCDVLSYLHLQDPSIVFRDVKPANIMRSSKGKIYLIDFGIARRYREGQSKDTRPLGSPGYAAPEQYGKAQSTPRTDMYGLGATLQTLLTGKEPEEIQAHGIPADCFIPDELQTLLVQMLKPDPEQRPAFMWRLKTSFKDLQKRYPVQGPQDWLLTLWAFLTILIAPLFFSDLIYYQLCTFAAFGWIVITTGYSLYKARRAAMKKLTPTGVRTATKKGLVSAFNLVMYIWAWGNVCSVIQVLTRSFSTALLVKLLVYVALTLAGGVFIQIAYPLMARQKKLQRTMLHRRQPVQVPLLEQEIHK